MTSPSITYTFSNGTTADGTQVNQNFTDLINSLTDATKSLSIDALTCAGTATFNGAVALGNGTPDDISVGGSLASSIPIKTTFSYDFGTATIGLKSVYFGSADSAARTTRIIGATVGSSWTLTLPTGAGTAGYKFRTNGSGTASWDYGHIRTIGNLGLSCSVGSNILTIALKGADGNDPSATNPIDISFRSATATTGTPGYATSTAATSVAVPASATLGHISSANQYVWVYAINNSGTVELAVSGIKVFDDNSIQSSTTISSGATSGTVLYSTTGRSNVGIRLIGRLLVNEGTAGTWASAPTEVAVGADPKPNIEEWSTSTRSLTPNNFGTISNATWSTRREGDTLRVKGQWQNGTVAASTASITLPSGLSGDTAKLGTGARPIVGSFKRLRTGVSGGDTEIIIYFNSGTATAAFFGTTSAGGIFEAVNVSSFCGTSDYITITLDIPIAGWSLYGP